MREPTHFSPTSLAYARALLELAEERKLPLEPLGKELHDLQGIVKSDNSFRLYLADPAIGDAERAGVIQRVFEGKISPLLYDFLRLLNQKDRLSLLGEIVDAFAELLDEKLGKVEVDLIVAHKLSQPEIDDARKSISSALKRDAVVHVYVEESIIGGAVLRVGDKLIDASVEHQLKSIKERLLASRPK